MSLASSVARARWSALFTDATLVSSSSATSDAFHRSTSHRISTARWRAGRCWSAATNARRIVSRATATSAGSPSAGTTSVSGTGSRRGSEAVPRNLLLDVVATQSALEPREGAPGLRSHPRCELGTTTSGKHARVYMEAERLLDAHQRVGDDPGLDVVVAGAGLVRDQGGDLLRSKAPGALQHHPTEDLQHRLPTHAIADGLDQRRLAILHPALQERFRR